MVVAAVDESGQPGGVVRDDVYVVVGAAAGEGAEDCHDATCAGAPVVGLGLGGPGVDSDAVLHRTTYMGVFADAGLDPA